MNRKIISTFLSICMIFGLTTGFGLNVSAASSYTVVISQAYGGGGNSGAILKNDFIELYNNTDSDVNIGGWTVFYAASATAGFSRSPNLYTDIPAGAVIKARDYYLIKESAGAGGTVGFVADLSGTIFVSATAFTVALVNNNQAVTGTFTKVPTGNLIDLVSVNAVANR